MTDNDTGTRPFMQFATQMVSSLENAQEEGRLTLEDQEVMGRLQEAMKLVADLQRDVASRAPDPALQYYMYHSLQAVTDVVDSLAQLRDQDYRRFRKSVEERLRKLEEQNTAPPQQLF